MNVFVKICGLTNAEDLAGAIAAGADAVGFVFAESPRRVTPEQAALLAGSVPEGVLKVAVMLHPSNDEWRAVAERLNPDVLQTDAEDFASLEVANGVRRWPVYRQRTGVTVTPTAKEYVYEGGRSGRGVPIDWRQAAEVARSNRMILAGGLGPGNVAEAIRAVRPWGVDASSGVERAPGLKDAAKMAAYVASARNAL